jgi:uncharacterized protein
VPQVARILLTILIGAAGGFIFFLVSLPLPWMLGSMCAVAALAIAGVPVVSVRKVRPPLVALIGVTLGSAFTPDTFARIPEWYPLTIATIISTILMGATGFVYLLKVARYDSVTAYFSAMPAGIYEMTYQGGLLGGDERRIALSHAVRIFMIVMIVPIAFRWFFDLGPALSGLRIASGPDASLGVVDAVILVLCAVVGWPVAKFLRFPNPPFIGALLASVAVHGAGIIETAPPYELVSVAQVLLGASIGGQFIGATFSDLRSTAVHAAVTTPLLLMLSVVVALITTQLSPIDFPTLLLSLSPGGLAEMSLIALALHIEVIAVVSHQFMRILIVNGFAVIVFRTISKMRKRQT